jgi:hypothetical protein
MDGMVTVIGRMARKSIHDELHLITSDEISQSYAATRFPVTTPVRIIPKKSLRRKKFLKLCYRDK